MKKEKSAKVIGTGREKGRGINIAKSDKFFKLLFGKSTEDDICIWQCRIKKLQETKTLTK